MPDPIPSPPARVPAWLLCLTIFGLYLSLRGYRSYEGDQAYRLPLLIDRQDPTAYAHDPFVRAFDRFNPHEVYLALLDLASRPAGLSFALFSLYSLAFALTCRAFLRFGQALGDADNARSEKNREPLPVEPEAATTPCRRNPLFIRGRLGPDPAYGANLQVDTGRLGPDPASGDVEPRAATAPCHRNPVLTTGRGRLGPDPASGANLQVDTGRLGPDPASGADLQVDRGKLGPDPASGAVEPEAATTPCRRNPVLTTGRGRLGPDPASGANLQVDRGRLGPDPASGADLQVDRGKLGPDPASGAVEPGDATTRCRRNPLFIRGRLGPDPAYGANLQVDTGWLGPNPASGDVEPGDATAPCHRNPVFIRGRLGPDPAYGANLQVDTGRLGPDPASGDVEPRAATTRCRRNPLFIRGRLGPDPAYGANLQVDTGWLGPDPASGADLQVDTGWLGPDPASGDVEPGDATTRCRRKPPLPRNLKGTLGTRAGLVAVALLLVARAGNIGTNHLFEPLLLDRLVVLGLGWTALSEQVGASRRVPWLCWACLGAGALLHPSLGFLLAGLSGLGCLSWRLADVLDSARRAGTPGFDGTSVREGLISTRECLVFWIGLALACLPGLIVHGSRSRVLFEGLSPEEFRLLSFQVQSPQHMLPHLWRGPQWLAWFGYMGLAAVAFRTDPARGSAVGRRWAWLLASCLAGLAGAWVAVEGLGSLRVTVLQPFRLATVARGLALVVLARYVVRLWERGTIAGRLRAGLMVAGLWGDLAMVVASATELTWAGLDALPAVGPKARWAKARLAPLAALAVLGFGLVHLARHDTESGHLPLLGTMALTVGLSVVSGRLAGTGWTWNRARAVRLAALAWMLPAASLVAGWTSDEQAGPAPGSVRAWLIERCRFQQRPIDDVERLAAWCRRHTPPDASFIGPPGPKSFRLWSRRGVAFNRAASPYHAEGLRDWSARFRAHVGLQGSTSDLARAYLDDRHGLEARYNAFAAEELAALAVRQGADHVLARAPEARDRDPMTLGPLELLRVEGRYGVYRVSPLFLARARDRGVAEGAGSSGTGDRRPPSAGRRG